MLHHAHWLVADFVILLFGAAEQVVYIKVYEAFLSTTDKYNTMIVKLWAAQLNNKLKLMLKVQCVKIGPEL